VSFRRVRTFADENDASDDEIINAIPSVNNHSEFQLSEKQTMHAVLLCIVMMTDVRRGILALEGKE
jgi:hypothetical protein